MAIDGITIVSLIYEAGASLVEQCKLAKRHPVESFRIAIRCVNILGILKSSQHEFTDSVQLKISLLELRDLLERVSGTE